MGAPGVEAEQNRSVRVEELAKVVVLRCKLARTSFTPMIVQVRSRTLPRERDVTTSSVSWTAR